MNRRLKPTAQGSIRWRFPRTPSSKQDSRWGFRRKTVWDWMQLLIVPLALTVIGLWFAAQQDARQQRIEDQRAEVERELAGKTLTLICPLRNMLIAGEGKVLVFLR